MKHIALIPARGGSKTIPLKNIRPFRGRPLIYWVLDAACACSGLDAVYVSTDSDLIAEVAQAHSPQVRIFNRAAETATDTASTESAMLEFAKAFEFEKMVLIQATMPFLSATHLSRGLELMEQGFDSVLSVVRMKRFVWNENGGAVEPLNYDPQNRPRRQDFNGVLIENGSFYITSRERLLQTKCRLSGRVAAVEMPEYTFTELDEPQDWVTLENLSSFR